MAIAPTLRQIPQGDATPLSAETEEVSFSVEGEIGELLNEDDELMELAAAVVDQNFNLAELMDKDERRSLASDLIDGIKSDKESRKDWERTYTEGLDLLGFKIEESNDQPFPGASAVTMPLIGEAVVSFQARALAETIPASGPVSCKVAGDATPEIHDQARRVSDYMNYFITEECEEYFSEHDMMLFSLPIAGCSFKKVYYDPTLGRPTVRYVSAEDLIVSFGATSLLNARVTHRCRFTTAELERMVDGGVYIDFDMSEGGDDDGLSTDVGDKKNEISGLDDDGQIKDDMHTLYEVHCDLDIEVDPLNTEGRLKPYIVTIHAPSGEAVAVRRNWDAQDSLYKRKAYFVCYRFLPSLSGIYGYGLPHLIGNLAKASTSILRQIIDAGMFSNLPAGFKAKGLKLREHDITLEPGKFHDVDAPGNEIAKGIMALPFKGPDQTLYAVLQYLVDTARRMAAIADVQVGDLQPNAPVGSTLAILDNADRIQSAIHRRLHQSQREEYRLLARQFYETLPANYPFRVKGEDQVVAFMDFDMRVDVLPVSDPNITSKTQRIALAQAKLQLAQTAPDLHDRREAYLAMYEAMGETDAERLLPDREKETVSGVDPLTEFRLAVEGKPVRAEYGQNHQAHMQALTAQLQMYSQNPAVAQTAPQVGSLVQALMADHQVKMVEEQVAASMGVPIQMVASGQIPPQMQGQFSIGVAQALQALVAQQQQAAQQQQQAIAQQQQAQQVELAAAVEERKAAAKAQGDAMLAQIKGQYAIQEQAMESQENITESQIDAQVELEKIAQKDRKTVADNAIDKYKTDLEQIMAREEQASDERLIRMSEKTSGITHT